MRNVLRLLAAAFILVVTVLCVLLLTTRYEPGPTLTPTLTSTFAATATREPTRTPRLSATLQATATEAPSPMPADTWTAAPSITPVPATVTTTPTVQPTRLPVIYDIDDGRPDQRAFCRNRPIPGVCWRLR